MTTVTLLPMRTGYSIIALPGQSSWNAGNTNGIMFNHLLELQAQLRAWKVRPDLIPQEDFDEARFIDIPS